MEKEWDEERLETAIKEYENGKYTQAYHTFNSLADKGYMSSTSKKGIEIYGQSTFYLALCYKYGHGVKKDKSQALGIANHLYKKNKFNNAWNVYRELIGDYEDDEKKLKILIKMANCYQNYNKLFQNEDINTFKTALELYNKKKYKEAFDIFSKLTSNGSSICHVMAVNFIRSNFNYYIPEHPAKCIVERKRWHHQSPFGLSSNKAHEYFNDIEVTEGNIISDEFINKENKTNYLQPIGNSEFYYDDVRVYPRKLRFPWLAREGIIPTSFENNDVGSIIEIYLIVKEIMKENYEVILKIIQEIERNSSQEGSIQSIEYLKKVIRPTPASLLKCKKATCLSRE
ncbi:25452_t:CDS:2 [Dentiscutata erythropus]|uniref:25452_t:CDS:1 n=1 Tax=Dentiscutata erythropus TaxID=1348616 RepID=A0A9N9AZL5_9GLOM|nr:25452_t:CDS:2 [Dentiscutata erythropus]